MKPIDLSSIRARAAQATPGPWIIDWDEESVHGIHYVVEHNHAPDAECKDDGDADDCPASEYKDKRIVETDGGHYPPRKHDAAFIAAAREDVPALLELVSHLTECIRQTKTYFDGAYVDTPAVRERVALYLSETLAMVSG